ncbi:hypothetical protein HDV01_004562 [Terramyces sp. JEL0728]|nr:hypothetical protein HDV01_004562 [Terramyces sp. JEL0728]
MKRTSNTCFGCQKKKQKCDRERPACIGCRVSKIQCVYPSSATPTKPFLSEEKQMELVDRLERLESSIKQSIGFSAPSSASETQSVGQSVDDNDNSFSDFEFMMIDRMLQFVSIMGNISPSYFRKHLNTSELFVCAIRAAYYFHHDVPDHAAKTSYWLEKANSCFGHSFSSSLAATMNATIVQSILHFKIDKTNEGQIYFYHSVLLAKKLGINKEETIRKLTNDEQEREDLRNFWWWLVHIDHNFVFNDENLIKDGDNLVFIPRTSQDEVTAYLATKIMSSDDWFTPSIPGLSIYSNRTLLTRIIGKALKYAKMYCDNGSSIDNLFIFSKLQDSLLVWYSNLPQECVDCLAAVTNRSLPIKDEGYLWVTLDAIVQYYYTKLIVTIPTVYKLILENSHAVTKNRIYLEVLSVCKEMSKILAYYSQMNPEYNFCGLSFTNYIYQFATPLICAMKLDPASQSVYQEQYDIIRSAIEALTEFQGREPVAVHFLDYLTALPSAMMVVDMYYRYVKYDSNPFHLFLPKYFAPPSEVYANSQDQ